LAQILETGQGFIFLSFLVEAYFLLFFLKAACLTKSFRLVWVKNDPNRFKRVFFLPLSMTPDSNENASEKLFFN